MRFSLWLTVFVINITVLEVVREATAERTITLSANVSFDDPEGIPVCVNTSTPIEIQCHGTDIRVMTWEINTTTIIIKSFSGNHRPNGLAALEYSRIQIELVNVMQAQTASNGEANITSRLVLNPSALRFGDQISCYSRPSTVIETLVYTKRFPPPPPHFTTSITKDNTDLDILTLTLHWNDSFTQKFEVDEYCVMDRDHVCQSETTCLTPNKDYECNGLEAGKEYMFFIRAKNCLNKTTIGENLTTIVISPRVPWQTEWCTSEPVYDQSTQKLIAVQNAWSPIPNPNKIAPGVNQDIISYNIAFERDGSTLRHAKNVSAMDLCRTGRCNYNLSATFSGFFYTFSIAAENKVGLGEYLTCTPRQISTMNELVTVAASTISMPGKTVIELHQLATAAIESCELCYWTKYQSLTCELPVRANSDGTATVILNNVQARLRYYYRINIHLILSHGDHTGIIISGSFSSACEMVDLVYNLLSSIWMGGEIVDHEDIIVDARCPLDSVGSLQIPNGVVCYTGTTPESTAIYICDDGFETTADTSQRTCLEDGHWSGETLTCLHVANSGKIKGVTVFAGIMILLAVGILISSLTFGIIAKRNIIKEKIFKRDIPSTLPQNVSEQLPDFLEYRDISDLNETGTGNNTNNVELSRLPDCSADLDSQNKAYKA